MSFPKFETKNGSRDVADTCYYAHAMSLYGTLQEERDISLLEALGFTVVNPNSEPFQQCVGIEDYIEVAAECDCLAFRAMPDGSITSGVAREIEAAKLVFELPSGISRRRLTLEQTLETLEELGQR